LTDLKAIPEDLENYVLKPLFSFSGTGVFHVKKKTLKLCRKRDILQKKGKLHPYSPIS
jgi:glutathione synthase/RimK-type ligase-like ATP-grasp enzyme